MKKVEFENSNQHGKKEFSWVKIDAEKNEMFCIVCRRYPTVVDKVRRLYVGINGSSATDFRRDSLVSHAKSHSHYFCFQRAKSEEKPEQALLQRISRKIDEMPHRCPAFSQVVYKERE